jgi:hypothetical protein
MRLLLLLLSLSITAPALSDQSLSNTLEALVRGEIEGESAGLAAFAAADYRTAFDLLRDASDEAVPYRERFVAAALLYQRDRAALLEHRDAVTLPAPQAFYLEHPPMTVSLDGATSAPLTVARFPATLMGEEEVVVLLDTGAAGVGIDQELVERYDMPRSSEATARGVLPFVGGIEFDKYAVVIPELSIGGLRMTHVPAEYSAFDEEARRILDASPLPEFDIIMGLDTFIGFVEEVRLDWRNGRITFDSSAQLRHGTPFLFHASKPFTAMRGFGEWWTTVVDTGSTSDMMEETYVRERHVSRRETVWRGYDIVEYRVPVEWPTGETFLSRVQSFSTDLDLVIGDERVEFLIGHPHERMVFNLADNRFTVEAAVHEGESGASAKEIER